MNGTGTRRRRPRPTATAPPEKRTARPAVAIVARDRVVDVAAAPAPRGSGARRAASSRRRARARRARRGCARRRPSTARARAGTATPSEPRSCTRRRRTGRALRRRARRPRAGRASVSGSAIASPAAQVGREDRVEVVLDRRLAGDVRVRRAGEGRPEGPRVAPSRAVGRAGVATSSEDDAVAGVERPDLRVRDPAGRLGDAATQARLQRPFARLAGPEDDCERPVRPFAEVRGEEVARPLRVGPRDVERVREERRQVRGCGQAGDEDGRPRRQHEDAEAEDETGPTLRHRRSLSSGFYGSGRPDRASTVVS